MSDDLTKLYDAITISRQELDVALALLDEAIKQRARATPDSLNGMAHIIAQWLFPAAFEIAHQAERLFVSRKRKEGRGRR